MEYIGYRHIQYNSRKKNYKLWTWEKDTGKRIAIETPFRPYLYIETLDPKSANAKSIYNTPLRKIYFDNGFERNKYVRECGIQRLFYNLPIEQQILIEEFGGKNNTQEFSKYPLKIFTIDIETYSPEAFPEPSIAVDPINLITVHDSLTNTYHTWGLDKEYISDKENVFYYQCESESDLLYKFINFWKGDYPDLVTGWNIIGFDIPYLINRITKLLNEDDAKLLSPLNDIYKRDDVINQFGKSTTRWHIRGISIIDYMDAYITFSREKRENYKLDYIGEIELGTGKISFNATSLSELADTNWTQFVEYNIQDTRIVVQLEEKLQFLMLVRMLAYLGLTNFESALGTVSIVTGALALQALTKNMIIPTFADRHIRPYDGGFVKEPQKGLHESVVSFDANSLYPNTIITLNISPETKIGKIVRKSEDNIEIMLSNGKVHPLTIPQFKQFIQQQEVAISKAGVLFSQKNKGFCPELVDIIYEDRVKDRKRLKELKLKRSKLEKELKSLIENDDQKSI